MGATKALQGVVIRDESANPVAVILDGAVYRLQMQGKVLNASGSQINPATQETLAAADGRLTTIDAVLDSIKDTDGIKKITDALPTGDNGIGRVKLWDGTEVADVVLDSVDGFNRLQIEGKVSITAPPTPPGGTDFILAAESPLEISQAQSPHLTSVVLPTSTTLFITQIVAGCQGDPSADGSKVEVFFWDGTTERIIDRIYVTGFTEFGNYPNVSKTRDGTTLSGDGTNELRIYRSRLSNSAQEIDAVVRGFTQ
jgi:hypothetical protein